MSDKKEIKACIAFLETNPKIEYNPYPCYPTEVTQALGFMGPDYDYLSHFDALMESGKTIEEYNLDELKTMFTFINRGERFCDGHIASFVENGELLRLLKRLLEMVESF